MLAKKNLKINKHHTNPYVESKSFFILAGQTIIDKNSLKIQSLLSLCLPTFLGTVSRELDGFSLESKSTFSFVRDRSSNTACPQSLQPGVSQFSYHLLMNSFISNIPDFLFFFYLRYCVLCFSKYYCIYHNENYQISQLKKKIMI